MFDSERYLQLSYQWPANSTSIVYAPLTAVSLFSSRSINDMTTYMNGLAERVQWMMLALPEIQQAEALIQDALKKDTTGDIDIPPSTSDPLMWAHVATSFNNGFQNRLAKLQTNNLQGETTLLFNFPLVPCPVTPQVRQLICDTSLETWLQWMLDLAEV